VDSVLRIDDARPDPALRLLIQCARASADASRIAVLTSDLSEIDWQRLIALAIRHALVPVLDRQLHHMAGVPESAQTEVRRLARINQVRSRLLSNELRRVVEALGGVGVPVIAYKGPALAHQIYGDVSLRSFVDLDVLVTPEDFLRARAALAGLGYAARARMTALQEQALLRGECDQTLVGKPGLIVELHWAVAPPHLSFALATKELLDRSRPLDLEGTQVRVPCPEDLVLLLAMNGAKDVWRSLEPIVLLTGLMVRREGLDWGQVHAVARRLGAERMVALALWLAVDLLEAPPPPELAATIARDVRLSALARSAKQHLLGERPPPAGELSTVLFRCRLRERWSDRVRQCVLRAAMPTVADCAGFPLPPRLWMLASIVRPFRMVRLALARGKKVASG
jgi:hypothetical protein